MSQMEGISKRAIVREPYFWALVVFFAWMAVGVFPLYCYEADSMQVVAGCEIIYNQGWSLPPVYSYGYEMGPLLTCTVVLLKYVFTFLTCEQLYCLFSAFCAVAFIFGCIEFAHRILSSSRLRILMALVLLPEMYAVAMYPNGAIPAAALFVWGLVLICDKRYSWSAFFLCVAPLYRVDVVVVYPVILPLFYYLGHSLKRSFVNSFLYAVIVVAVLVACYIALRASNVWDVVDERDRWTTFLPFATLLIGVFGYYSLFYVLLLPLGAWRILADRAYKLFFLVIVPVFLQHYIWRHQGCASKHYLYISPFVIICGVYAMSWLSDYTRRRRWLRRGLAVTVLALMLVSVRLLTYQAWRELPESMVHVGPNVDVWKKQFSKYTLSVGIGAGHQLYTQDEYMLASGHLFYPLYIHRYKVHDDAIRINAREYLRKEKGDYNLYGFTFPDKVFYTNLLLSEGYLFSGLESRETYTKYFVEKDGRRILFVGDSENAEDKVGYVREMIREYSRQYPGKAYMVSSSGIDISYYEQLAQEGVLRRLAYGFYQVVE